MFSNQIGCDGERLYFDGCSSIACNGDMIAMGDQFSVREVVLFYGFLESTFLYHMFPLCSSYVLTWL